MKAGLSTLALALAVVGLVAGCGGAGSANKDFGKSASLGQLTIALGPAHPGTITNTSVPLGVTNDVVMAQIRCSADSVEDIRLNTLKVYGVGSGHEVDDLQSLGVELYVDVNHDGLLDVGDTFVVNLGYSTDGGSVSFNIATDIPKNTSIDYLVVYDFDASSQGGSTFTVSVQVTASDIVALGKTSNEPPTLSGTAFSGITATIVGTLTISAGANNPLGANVSNHASGLSVLQVNLAANAAENINVSSFTITAIDHSPTDLPENTEITQVTLHADVNGDGIYQPGTDTQLGTAMTYSADNGTITFTAINRVVTAGSSQDWIVVYNVNSAGGNNFSVDFAATSDVSGTGSLSSLPPFLAGTAVTGSQFATIQTGVLTVIAGGTNPTSNTMIPEGSVNQLALAINLTASSYENIQVTSITFTHSGSGVLTGATPNDLAQARLYNIDGAVNISTTTTFTANSFTFSGLTQTINSGVSRNWAVYLNFSSGLTTSGGNTFRISLASGNDLTATGSISSGFGVTINATIGTTLPQGPSPTLTLQETLVVKRGPNSPASGSIGPSGTATSKEILQLELNAYCDQVRISSITLLPSGSGDDQNEVSGVDIYIDANNDGLYTTGETQIATGAYATNDSQQTFNFSSAQVISPGTPLYLVVLYRFGTTGVPGDDYTVQVRQSDLSPYGLGSLTSGWQPTIGTPPGTWPVQGATLSYGATLQLGMAASNPGLNHTVLRSATNLVMLGVTMTETTNLDDVDVTSITITAVGGMNNPAYLNTQIAAVRLYFDANNNGSIDAGEQRDTTKTYSTSSNQITFSITAGPTQGRIPQNNSRTFWVQYDFTATAANQPWVGCSYAVSIAAATDVTASCVTMAASASVSNAPVRGGYQVIQGVWSGPLTVNNTAWGVNFSSFGIFQNSMIFCPVGGTGGFGRLISTGGFAHNWNLPSASGNTWITWGTYSLDLGAASLQWIGMLNTGSPPGGTSIGHTDGTMVYCTIGGNPYFIYYGGYYNTGLATQGVYTYNINAASNPWSLVNVGTSTPPSGQGRYRNGYGIDLTGTNPVLYVFGGYDGSARQNDLYTMTLTSATAGTWAAITGVTGAPSARNWCASCIDTVSATGTRFLISGGEGATTLAADGAYFTAGASPTWTSLTSLSNPRTQAAFAWDPDAKSLIVFGGLENSGPGNTGSMALEIHLIGCTNTGGPPTKVYYGGTGVLPNTPGAPQSVGNGRGRMPGVWDPVRHRFIIFGGSNMMSTNDISPLPSNPPYTNHRSDMNIYVLS